MKHIAVAKLVALTLVTWLFVACGGGDESALPPASAHKNATTVLVEPQNGWWWNPAESGRGFSIERQGNQIFMAAYLYETNGLATWYVAGLTRQSSGAYSGALQRYSGGQTLLGNYKPPAPTTSVVANALLSFNTASTGSLMISFADGSPNRTISIERFAFAANAPSKGSFENGWWWNEAESGRGYFIETQGSVAFVGSYMFDSSGQPTWYVSAAALQGTQSLSGTLDQYTNGQSLGSNFKAPTKVATGAGTLTFNFSNSTTANMVLPNGKSVALKRFIFNASTTTSLKQDVTANLDKILGMIGGDATTGITQQLSLILQQVIGAESGSTCPTASITPALTDLKQIPPNLQIAIDYATSCTAKDGKVMSGSAAIAINDLLVAVDDVTKTTSLSVSSFSANFNNIKVNGATFASGSVSGDLGFQIGQDAAGAMSYNSGHATLQLTNLLLPNSDTISGTIGLNIPTANNELLSINLLAPSGDIVLNLSGVTQADGTGVLNTTQPGQGKGYAIEIKNLKLNSKTCPSNYPIGGSIVFTKTGQTATATFDASCSGKYAYSDSTGATS